MAESIAATAGGQAAGTPGSGTDPGSEDSLIRALRPRNFGEYVGQGNVISSLKVAVQAAKQRAEAVDHVLFHGPPGLGKTTLAHIIAREMGVKLTHTSGPALERPVDMVGLLSNLEAGEVLFIDEIHRLSHAVEEYLYSAMEDFVVDFVTGKGAYSRTLSFPLKRFTLVGATTRAGMLSAPLRDRFGMVYHLDYYSPEELTRVVVRSAQILEVKIEMDGAAEIARRSRGVPRVANRLLRRVRDYAEVHGKGVATLPISRKALEIEGVDELGLDRLDRQYLSTLAVQYRGGPAGIEAIAATINEDSQTLVDVVEPFLLKIGFIIRTPQGRKATPEGLSHLGVDGSANADADADRKQGKLGI
ncbi:MAG: Holliday junction branch migration DNA helicase RuvB [Chloroflexi bacterium]|nr:Holliday junction branch migration DNA helicase RuvB [Chloroflexota bacterium]